MSNGKPEDITVVDEVEVSKHHTVTAEGWYDDVEWEVHAGMADTLYVSKETADRVKNQLGLDLEAGEFRCGADVVVVDDE